MSFDLRIKHDLKELKRDLTRAQRRALPDAQRKAMNKALTSATVAAAKVISKRIGVKQAEVKAATDTVKAAHGRLRAEIAMRGKPFNLIRFGARQTKKGVTAAPWRRRRLYPGAFIVGGKTVFRRKGKARLPIRSLKGPSVPPELLRRSVRAAIMDRFGERWSVELDRALRNELRKMGFR